MRACILALAAGLAAAPAAVADPDPDAGAALFGAYCAACHGVDARGGGPMAEILSIEPPDLTVLAAGAGGAFPLARVVRQIDGRDVLLAHGGPMPIFGTILEGESGLVEDEDGTPVFTTQAVVDIAAWLATIQR